MKILRLRLIGVMVLVALLPALPAALIVHSLVRRSFDPWLEGQVLDGVRAGLAATRERLEEAKRGFVERLSTGARVDTLSESAVASLGAGVLEALRPAAAEDIESTSNGAVLSAGPERIPIDGRDLLVARVTASDGETLWLSAPLPEGLAAQAGRVTEAIRILEALGREREAVASGLVAAFVSVYGVVLVIAVGLGLFVAARLTRPMGALAAGIDRVSGGDLETRLDWTRRGEMGKVLRNFDLMVERLRRQREELVRLERLAAWRQMARSLAHEIKNPLTPIQLAAQQMREMYRGDDPEHARLLREGTAIIEEEVQVLRNLVQEFSQFARLPGPQMARASIGSIFEDVTSLYGGDRVRARLRISGATAAGGAAAGPGAAAGDIEWWCDREQIHRVLVNLINNALAAQEETHATEAVEVIGEFGARDLLRIHVLDRGPGVPVESRRRIFEPDVSTRRGGMGLGLAIVEGIVRGHGGTVEVGDRDGGGAVFTVALPVRGEAPAQGERDPRGARDETESADRR
jgi:nitrogen fixation/metabolism regulation signal transduction histidine kinase